MSYIFEDIKNKMDESANLVKLAKFQLEQGNYSFAISFLDNALKLNSQNEEASFYKGIALYKLEEYQKALKYFSNLLKKGTPFIKESWYYKGLCYKELNDYPNAKDCFQEALKIKKRYKEAKKELEGINKRFAFENQKMKEILEFEFQNQREVKKIDLISHLSLSIDDATYFLTLLNTQTKYVLNEIPDLKTAAAKILRAQLNPTFYDLIVTFKSDFRMAQKLRQFLINENLVSEIPRFPRILKPKPPQEIRKPPDISSSELNPVEPVEPPDQNEFPCWELIDPLIQSISKDLFEDGHYAEAIFNAFKEIVEFVKQIVKEKTGEELEGRNLMFRAFLPDNPVIFLADLSQTSELDIQEGYQHIFAGATQAIRNLLAHKNITLDKIQATHLIFLASLLMNKLDNAGY